MIKVKLFDLVVRAHGCFENAAEAEEPSICPALCGKAPRIAALSIAQVSNKLVEPEDVEKLADSITSDIPIAITAFLASSRENAENFITHCT